MSNRPTKTLEGERCSIDVSAGLLMRTGVINYDPNDP